MRADITAEQLVEFFERMVQRLVEQGVPAERVADALSVMSVRAGVWTSSRGVEGSVRNPSTPGGWNGTETSPEAVHPRV